jgi:hypothetical protein
MITIVFAQTNEPYNFPVKPGTEQWKNLQTHDEMLAVCQLPQSYLKQSTTAALVKTCLNYPMLLEFMAYNNFSSGIDTIISHFNGFQELLKRTDNARSLQDEYAGMTTDAVVSGSKKQEEKGLYSFQIILLEHILCKEAVLQNNDARSQKELANLAYGKMQSMSRYKEVFGEINKVSTSFLLGNMMKKNSPGVFTDDELIDSFLKTGRLHKEETVNKIVEKYKSSIK